MASKSPAALAKRSEYQRNYRTEWRAENPNYDHAAHYQKYGRRGHLRRKYGLTEHEYTRMLLAGGFACHICAAEDKPLVVDHEHNSKEVRGLLCKQCNFMLGHARDSQTILQNAARYLERRTIGPLMLSWDRAQNILRESDGE